MISLGEEKTQKKGGEAILKNKTPAPFAKEKFHSILCHLNTLDFFCECFTS
jgi:hypothetical protein